MIVRLFLESLCFIGQLLGIVLSVVGILCCAGIFQNWWLLLLYIPEIMIGIFIFDKKCEREVNENILNFKQIIN